MGETEVVVKQSPFVFLKRVAVAEFVLAVLPLFVVAVFDLQTRYEAVSNAFPISYSLGLAKIANIPNPAHYAGVIRAWIAAQPAPAALLEPKALPDLVAEGEG